MKIDFSVLLLRLPDHFSEREIFDFFKRILGELLGQIGIF